MWKNLFTIAICTSVSITNVYAQKKVNLTLHCDSLDNIASIIEKHSEKLMFVGLDTQHNVKNLNLSLFLNKDTKTYSAVFVTPDTRLVCIASSGEMGETFAK